MTLELTKELIRRPSITPDDKGCQTLISERLAPLGFHIEPMRFGQVDNLWARHGTEGPLVVFAGHTDVVPHGPLDAWASDPFTPVERDGFLYGRGATDMKSGLAAMVVAAEQFIKKHPDYKGSIAFLITSDEEGPSINGTQRVVEVLQKRQEKINYCIVGEASSDKTLGDRIYVGRRGSLNGILTVHGKQSHIAYPHLADNPIHKALAALEALTNTHWDNGNEHFPPTSFQISNIHAGTGATNVIPAKLEVTFNFRFTNEFTVEALQERVHQILQEHQLNYTVEWLPAALPFLTKQGTLIQAVKTAIKSVVNQEPILATSGGTSDGRFIAPTGTEVIELGPCNTSAHQIDEHVRIEDLEKLTTIYQNLLKHLFL